jgi:hypothetical protein
VTAGSAFQYGLAFLIPALRAGGLSLGQAGVLVACPTAGLLPTLIGWGAAADRWGERRILAGGLTLARLLLLAASQAQGMIVLGACLLLAAAVLAVSTNGLAFTAVAGIAGPAWAGRAALTRSRSAL